MILGLILCNVVMPNTDYRGLTLLNSAKKHLESYVHINKFVMDYANLHISYKDFWFNEPYEL